MSRSKKLIKQTAWYSLFSNSKTLLQFFSSIVLARLLTPADFGLVAMVSVIIGFTSLFMDLGMSTAYIQKHEVDKSHQSALFVQSSVSGLFLALLIMALKEPIAGFYENAALAPIIVWMAADLFITALYTAPVAMLRRDSRFKELGLVSIFGFLLSFVVTVVFAVFDSGAMSIVYGVFIKDVFMLITTSYMARWKPSIELDKTVFIEMFRLGGWLSLTRILGFFGRQIDTLLVGKYFGAVVLGIYNRAYAFMLLPLQKVGNVVAETSLPTLKDYQNDNKKLYNAIEKILVAELILLIPFVTFFWSERYFIIGFVYGEQWIEVASYLTYLLPVALLDLSRSSLLQAFIVKGRTKIQFILSVLFTGVVVFFIVIGVMTGDIMKLVMFYSLSKIIIWLPVCLFSIKMLEVNFNKFIISQLYCVIIYWPLYLLVVINYIIKSNINYVQYVYVNIVLFSFFYIIATLLCLVSLSKKTQYEYLYRSFPFLSWPNKIIKISKV